ncbi:DoxX family protein [uncultured Sphingomonas sp.]|uniref:DoxX family protein n=1 Tax=uncultured Sphingomonas sp. TaxID=158754 RepID=UPI0025EFA763|nr:DoxX family protein [uncultured Sphingomonas sp.]
MAIVRMALRILLSLPLAAFFAFVGWMKASAPVETLAQHGAWTVRIPEPLGRAVGVSEIVCALLLLGGLLPGRARVGAASAMILIVNQMIAAAVHASAGEGHALPQNAVLIAALALVAWLSRRYFSVR